jgi:hypothetical protein
VRQREENHARAGREDRLGRRIDELERRVARARKTRIHRRERLPRELARSDRGDLGMRMPRKNADEFLARISAGTDDDDFFETHDCGQETASRRTLQARNARAGKFSAPPWMGESWARTAPV